MENISSFRQIGGSITALFRCWRNGNDAAGDEMHDALTRCCVELWKPRRITRCCCGEFGKRLKAGELHPRDITSIHFRIIVYSGDA